MSLLCILPFYLSQERGQKVWSIHLSVTKGPWTFLHIFSLQAYRQRMIGSFHVGSCCAVVDEGLCKPQK